MNLQDFLHFNHECPICREPLDLYMQWYNSTLWKSLRTSPDTYKFTPFKLQKDLNEEDNIVLQEREANIETFFSKSSLAKDIKNHDLYFFYLCNDKGFVDKGEPAYDYEINLYKGCYYRSSVVYSMKQLSKKKWELAAKVPEQEKLINQEESFSFTQITSEVEKVYMLSLKSVDNITKLWHYSATNEQKKDDNFEPKVFDKEMPYLTVRPKFDLEVRDKLIDRFDSWIIMS